jgi:alpha-galactosidase
MGRAGDGESRLRPLQKASRLGASLPRAPGVGAAQSAGAQPGAARCARLCLGFLDKLLTENDIAFLKWDYNRNWSEPGWDQLPAAEQKRVYVEFTRNLYGDSRRAAAKHPNVEIESCSGGGGRVDLGILRYTDEVWPSDNTDPFDRLTQQDGFTYAYTPQVMMAWVTDSPHWLNKRTTSLEYRMLSSMQGSLGIGANINKWSDEETATAKRLIAAYHQVQPTIVQGNLYRLISPRNGSEFSATQTVRPDKSQSVVFAFHPFDAGGNRGLPMKPGNAGGGKGP